MNQKKARKLRKLTGVIVHSRREYTDGHGIHHRFPVDGLMVAGNLKWKRRVNWRFPHTPGTIRLAEGTHRKVYQRIKRTGTVNQILNAKAV